MQKNDLVTTRLMHEEDRNFILATWLKGLRYGNDWFQAIDSNVYFAVYQKVILAILADPRVTVNVACLKDDPEVILGYSVHSGNRLDWLFVKKSWRCIGIGKSLIPEGITLVSHLTSVGRSISRRRNWVFNPFSIS